MDTKRKTKINKKRVFSLLVILLLLIIIIAVSIKGLNSDSSEKVYSLVGEVKTEDVSSVIFTTGKIESNELRNISFGNSGKVDVINFEVGSEICSGEVIAILDTDELNKQIEKAEMDIKIQEKNIQKIRQSGILNYETSYSNSKITFADAEANYIKNKALYENDIISESQYQEYDKAYKVAENNMNDLKRKYEGYGTYFDLEIAKLQLENLAKNLENLEKKLDDYTLKMPIKGTLTNLNLNIGQVIQGNIPVGVVETTDKLVVITQINQYDINNVEIGQDVSISRNGDDTPVKGKVKKIYPTANTSGTSSYVTVEIEIVEENIYKPNFSVNIEILTDKSENALLVPYGALLVDAERKTYLYKVVHGKANKIYVEKGINGALYMEVISTELETGDTILINPSEKVEEGSKINILDKE